MGSLGAFSAVILPFVGALSAAGFTPPGVAGARASSEKESGTLQGLSEILSSLRPHLEKRQPKPCRPYVEQLEAKAWPVEVAARVSELVKLTKRNKFKEALEAGDAITGN